MAVLCSNCSGKLIFNPASQKLECTACGSMFSPEDVSDFNADIHSKYYDTRVYTCAHCGAEVVTSDTEVSTFCIYCGNPAINFTRISKEYRPDGLIPFKITKTEALKRVKEKFLKNPIIPKEVKNKAVPENIRGIYVPYWIVNARFTQAEYISGDIHFGKYTERKHFQRAGSCNFKNMPIDGSNILNDKVSMKLEPFYFEDAKEFDEDYLNGFYSNTSDMTYEDLRGSAAERCHELFSKESFNSVAADNKMLEDSVYWIDIQDNPLYLMLPVWFFTFKYKGEPHTILINGQTGKVVGTMPWEQKRIYSIFWSIFFLVLTVMTLCFFGITFNLGGLSNLYNMLIIAIILFSTTVFTTGLVGLKKVIKNNRITKSEDIFKFVKKRQA